MNNESDLWNNEGYLDNGQSAPNNPNNTSNNQESVYPKFGHYSNEKNYSNYTNYANLLCPVADGSNPLTGNSVIGKCNATISALGVPPLVNDFWSNSRGSSASSAFSAVLRFLARQLQQRRGRHVSLTNRAPRPSSPPP